MNSFDTQLSLPCVYRWQPHALTQEVQRFGGFDGLSRARFDRVLSQLAVGLPGDWQDLVDTLRAKQISFGRVIYQPPGEQDVNKWHPHNDRQARRGCCGQWVCCDCDC